MELLWHIGKEILHEKTEVLGEATFLVQFVQLKSPKKECEIKPEQRSERLATNPLNRGTTFEAWS